MLIVLLHNESNLAPVSDYRGQVRINDRVIWEGRVEGHTREDGWPALLRMLADAGEK